MMRLFALGAAVALLPLGAMSGRAVAAQKPSNCQTDDKAPPTLTVHSSPPKGTRVKPGQKIHVNMTATEPSTQSTTQSGIRVIKLFAEDSQVAVKSFGTCGPKATPRTYAATYTVQSDPPPIVELRAHAQDWVGNDTSKIADFPTGDFSGTVNTHLEQPVPSGTQIQNGHFTISLKEPRHGRVEGTIEGDYTQTLNLSTCPSTTVSPGHVSVHVTGTRDDREMSLRLGAASVTEPSLTPCPGAGEPGKIGQPFDPRYPVAAAFAHLRLAGGKYRAHYSKTVPSAAPFTVTYTTKIERAR